MDSLINQLNTLALTDALPFLLKLAGALVLWFIGRTIIGGFQRVLQLTLQKRKLDATLIRYVESLFGSSLTILLLLGLLGMLGIETTSFAALLAAAGIAIGSAWAGLLSNFAAGVFLLVLRPFKVGEEISAGGVIGLVHEIGLFVTTIDTPDNVRIHVGNSRLFGDNIINYHAHPNRRLVVRVPLVHGADVAAVRRAVEARLEGMPDVLADPPVSTEVVEFTVLGPVLAVQAWCEPTRAEPLGGPLHNAISEAVIASGYSIPEPGRLLLSRAG